MAADDLRTALEDVRQALLAGQEQGLGDRELLTRFLEQRDEAAFAALVRRHAPMVWGVCRRTLRNAADVEDAFQATFLVLVRKAASVTPREMVGNFLYGVARQTALKARATAARRGARERQVARMPEPEAKMDRPDDLQHLLDEELGRLPDKYRAVLVLCELEGQSRGAAARHLGLPEGTVASRLARARAMLARRLAGRGLAVPGTVLAAALAREAAASAPTAAVSSAIRAACALAAGQGAAVVSTKVLALTEGVVKAMLVSRLTKVTVLLLALSTALAYGMLAAGGRPPGPPPGQGEPAARKGAEPAPPAPGPAEPLPAGALACFGSPRLQDFTIERSAAFSPDGKRLATSGANSPICVWDRATGELVRTYPNRGSVFDLRWKLDGKLAALTFFGHDVFLMQEFGGDAPDLDQEDEKRLREEAERRERRGAEARGGVRHLYSCFLSADGRRAVALWNCPGQPSRRAAVYRFATAQTSDTAKVDCEFAIPNGYGAWLSGDGKVLLVHASPPVDGPNRLVAFDLVAGKGRDEPAWELKLTKGQEGVPDECFSPDGKRVVVLLWGGAVELWDGPSGQRVRELGKLPWYYLHNNGERRGIDLSPDGKRLVLIDRGPDGLMGGRVVDTATGKDVCRLAPRPMPRSGGVARFSADGKWVARVSYGTAGIWNAETGEDACPLPGHRGSVNSLVVLPGGARVVTAGEDLTARAWDPATGKEVWRAALPQVVKVTFATPDGAVVLQERAGNTMAALCLDAATGKERPLPGKLAQAREDDFLACSPDGTTVVTLDLRKAVLRAWSWPAGELRTTAPLTPLGKSQPAQCGPTAFTPDGKYFVAVMYYSNPDEQQVMRRVPDHPFVETWDLAAGKMIGRTEVPIRKAPLLIPHPTGLYFWGLGDEVRDAVSGRVLVKLHIPENRGLGLDWIRAMALSPDGRTLAVAWGFNDQHLLLFETWTGRFREMPLIQGKLVMGLSFLPDGRLVSLGTVATVWSVGLRPAPAPGTAPLREWDLLTDPDPEKAWPAMGRLAGTPEAAELIGSRIHPIPTLSAAALERIFRGLDAEPFRDREEAGKELDRLGALAVPRVKARLAQGASPELKRRLEAFLADHDREDPAPEELRALRAVAVLEAIGTPAARKALADLAGGEPSARLTREAAGAMRRLGRR